MVLPGCRRLCILGLSGLPMILGPPLGISWHRWKGMEWTQHYQSLKTDDNWMMTMEFPMNKWMMFRAIPIWWFKWGSPPSHHPFLDGIFPYKLINQPLLGVPHFRKPPHLRKKSGRSQQSGENLGWRYLEIVEGLKMDQYSPTSHEKGTSKASSHDLPKKWPFSTRA